MIFKRNPGISFTISILALFISPYTGRAMDITDTFSIGGTLAGAYQYQDG